MHRQGCKFEFWDSPEDAEPHLKFCYFSGRLVLDVDFGMYSWIFVYDTVTATQSFDGFSTPGGKDVKLEF